MRIRSIRPEFWTSEDVAAMDWHTRLVYIGLWSYVDDNGVGRDIERLITTDLFALDDDLTEASVRVHGALKHLNTHGQITRYSVNGKRFLHITAWNRHQKINRPTASRYPLPTSTDIEVHGGLTEDSLSPQVNAPLGEGEKGRRGEGISARAHATHAPTKPRPAKRAATLPEDFTLTDSRRTYALSKNIPADIEFEAFTNHHTAKGSTFKDWDAAWRTWVGNAVKFGRSTRDVPTPTRIAPYERAGVIYDDHGVYADWHNATPVSRAGQIIHDPLGRAGTPIIGGAHDLWAEQATKEAS